MISDEDVLQEYQNILSEAELLEADAEIDDNRHQIFRGISTYSWKGQHPASCFRHYTVFNKFGVIPQYCFNCYKVLIEPRSVVELFKLLMLFEKIKLPHDNTRKCICESRDFCSGTYKGFIYCRGMEEARAVLIIARELVSENISPDISIKLKRGCSEFEHAYPKYGRIMPGKVAMKYKKQWKDKENYVDANAAFSTTEVDTGAFTYKPSDVFVMRYWLGYAATIGDMSYLQIAGMTLPPIPSLKRPSFENNKKTSQ